MNVSLLQCSVLIPVHNYLTLRQGNVGTISSLCETCMYTSYGIFFPRLSQTKPTPPSVWECDHRLYAEDSVASFIILKDK